MLRVFCILGLGGVGIYLMLPRGQFTGHRLNRWIGAALATLSLVLLATAPVGNGLSRTLLSPLEDSVTCTTFHILAAFSLISAVMMITSRNPVYSALWFALVLLSNSGLYLIQGAEFLSAATIIIYAGAIIVTFLFVIMLAQPAGTAPYDRVTREPFLACVAGVLLSGALVSTIHYSGQIETSARGGSNSGHSVRPSHEFVKNTLNERPASWWLQPTQQSETRREHVERLGQTLFLDHYVSIEVIGVLLLAAVVGAMLIASHKIETS